MSTRRFVTLLLLLPGCSRPPPLGGDSGVADEALRRAAAVMIEPAPVATHDETPRLPATHGEARRLRVSRFREHPVLAAREALLRDHFGGTPPAALEIQIADLVGDRQVALVHAGGEDPRPLLLVVDRAGTLLWQKDRPLPRIETGARSLTITAGPLGGVALSWYDLPTHIVAMRMWDGDGGIFADFQLFEMEACETLSALTWPGQGWLVVGSQPGETRAQLLGEDGKVAWPRGGVTIGDAWRAASPASLVLDTDETVMVFQPGFAPGDAVHASDHALVWRFDERGRSVWGHPIDLGELAPPQGPPERIAVARLEATVVRANLLAPDRHLRSVTVTSAGTVRPGAR